MLGVSPLALHGGRFRTGSASCLKQPGACQPCSKMEAALAAGGYRTLRDHGGSTARVLIGDRLAVGDGLTPVEAAGGASST